MADVDKDAVISGFEYEFVSTVFEDFHCLICQLPLREPVLTRCGHRYCKKCLNEAMKRQQVPECPVDRERLDREKDIFPDKATERSILSCHVRCPSIGCEWTGETRDAETHLQTCACRMTPCPNPHCDVTMEKRLVDDHVTNTCQWRMVQCGYCGENHAKRDEEKHVAECRRRPSDCSNGCGEVLAKEEMMAHQDVVCSHTVVSCQYDYLGCDSKIKRCDVEDHLEQNLRCHFELSVKKLADVQDETRILRQEMEKIKLDYRKMESKLIGIDREITEVKLKHKEMETFAPFIWKVTEFWERVNRARKDKEVRVESDPFYVGPQGYKVKLAMYPNGTKEAKNAYISLYIALMKGKYDPILPWPFLNKVTLSVLDQNPNVMQRHNFVKSFVPEASWKSMKRPEGEENERRGFGRFLSHDKLRSGFYLVDDILFIKFEIGPADASYFG